jgi:DSF synthase
MSQMHAVAAQSIPIPALQHVRAVHDLEHRALWSYILPSTRPCVTFDLLRDLRAVQEAMRQRLAADREAVRYLLLASEQKVFSLGGDLELMLECVRNDDRETLRRYAHACVDVIHSQAVGLGFPITTIAVVTGDAMGGGFEAALACDVVIVERQVQLGFPEILFNMLPGMGGYPLLMRRIGSAAAERLILSGVNYSAERLHEMGVVDIVAEPGQGEAAARQYLARAARKENSYRLLGEFRRGGTQISRARLIRMVDAWVEAAFTLSETDLRIMERLREHQQRAIPQGRSSAAPLRKVAGAA